MKAGRIRCDVQEKNPRIKHALTTKGTSVAAESSCSREMGSSCESILRSRTCHNVSQIVVKSAVDNSRMNEVAVIAEAIELCRR